MHCSHVPAAYLPPPISLLLALEAPKQLLAQLLADRLKVHKVAVAATVAGVLFILPVGQCIGQDEKRF